MDYFAPINGDQLDPDRPYINANPGAGIEGSWPHAKAIEGPMREIVKVITEAGLTPDGEDFTQLYVAIQALIAANVIGDATTSAKGIVELATGAETLTGTDTTRAVTPASLTSGLSKAAAGYMKLPGGLIIQWGKSAHINGNQSAGVTFPIAFPTALLAPIITPEYGGGSGSCDGTVYNLSTTGLWINNIASIGAPYFYFVIGH